MIFPIGDDNVKGGAYPFFSYLFLALNVIAFFYTISNGLERAVNEYGANPCAIKSGTEYFDLITSMFMHGGIMHLVGNMLFLWIFADNIESTIGNIRFLVFYLLGGIVAAFVHIYIASGTGCIPMVGASGAISAVLGAYLVMFPRSRIKLLFFIKVFYIPAFLFLGFWIMEQLVSGFTSLDIFGDPKEGSQVAFWAHIGGFVFGLLAGWFFKTKSPIIVDVEDRGRNHKEYQSVKVRPKRYNNRFPL